MNETMFREYDIRGIVDVDFPDEVVKKLYLTEFFKVVELSIDDGNLIIFIEEEIIFQLVFLPSYSYSFCNRSSHDLQRQPRPPGRVFSCALHQTNLLDPIWSYCHAIRFGIRLSLVQSLCISDLYINPFGADLCFSQWSC